ncbi:MAG: hypothetical protein EZS28_029562 [Streblomastix strix]|uniref:Right handed beta helix domain-containing protein n=1 Tax=Streblomastix strix TaxID=222440 RepID=A0A5J4UYD6_9EUKA|nr:MAG: hypothetical protein EZS28_029562 [Streblomastix strix]
MIVCQSHQQFEVFGDEFYVGASGNDSNTCQYSNQCSTLSANALRVTIDSATEYTVYVMDQTILSSLFSISSTLPSPRTFTNNPLKGTTQSEIKIINDGQFDISGNSHIEHIKFIMQGYSSYQFGGAIIVQLNESSRTLEIISCSFIGCNADTSGGALYLQIINQAEITLRNITLDHCEAQYNGGAIYTTLESGGKLTISGLCLFTYCKTLSNYEQGGGGIYVSINGENNQLIFEDCATFERCSAFDGGGMYMNILNNGKLTMNGSCSFIDCESTDSGGGFYINASDSNYDINLLGSMQFERCTGKNGGGLFFSSEQVGQITINVMQFSNCKSQDYGGGLYTNITSGAQMTIIGITTFYNCHSTGDKEGYGGGQYLETRNGDSIIRITGELEYNKCEAFYGGGLYADIRDNAIVEINKLSFTDCLSKQNGGGIYTWIGSEGQFTISGTALFLNCNSSTSGGGIYLETNDGTVSFNPTEQILIENCNSTELGGGIYCSIINNGQISLNSIKLNKCNSQKEGGGIYASIINGGGQLILDKSCQFDRCKSYENGGGIYATINFTTQCKFITKDAYIHDCKALNSTNTSLRYSESGFGGGIFLTGLGDYDPSSKLIDLRGMKIYNNSADKYGQSLYVAMPKVVEWCKYGILGEFVKGNYSDTYSDENELLGIPKNLIDFYYSCTQEQIQQQQQPLEHWWRILGILKSAQVIVNISNPNGKLIIQIEGKRMFQGYLSVKIFELRDKTQEEIDQDQKQMNNKYYKNSFKSLISNSSQFTITPKIETDNQKQIFINSYLQIEKKLWNNANEIIYPPEDGSSSPISIEGEIESDQKATFGMNEYKWLNYKEKQYGVLISNDRNIFTGKDGIDIEEDANVAVLLEVIIAEEEKGKRKGLPIGIIVGIAVGAFAVVVVIIIIIIIALFISNKKSKKVVRSYGHEIGMRRSKRLEREHLEQCGK